MVWPEEIWSCHVRKVLSLVAWGGGQPNYTKQFVPDTPV